MLSITTTEAAPLVVIFDERASRALNPCSFIIIGALCPQKDDGFRQAAATIAGGTHLSKTATGGAASIEVMHGRRGKQAYGPGLDH